MGPREGAVSITDKTGATMRRTADLVPGDRVRLPGGLVRTVASIEPSGWLNYRNAEILNVMYSEAAIPGLWSDGNSSAPNSLWEVAS